MARLNNPPKMSLKHSSTHLGLKPNLGEGPRKHHQHNGQQNRPKLGAGKKYREAAEKLVEQRKALPIFDAKKTIVETIQKDDCVIVVGETGSGKTTQIPQYLLECGMASKGAIAVTQPRRVAATSLATRVSEEVGCKLGTTVGYTVRFDDTSSPATLIKYLTDGMLLREILSDPLLSRYSVIILDEAHERTLRTDVLFGMLKRIQKARKGALEKAVKDAIPLKIVIMSATLDAEKFSTYFDDARILYVSGRQHAVKVFNTVEPQTDYLDSAVLTTFQIHLEGPPGDILIFLSGQEEIESLEKLINEYAKELPETVPSLLICPIYGSLPAAQQIKVFLPAPENSRKVILATNIAETSITISGIRYVVDCGVAKMRTFSPKIGIESLLVQPISKSSARQRTGRAGREAPGICYRLYPEEAFEALAESIDPEIKRCNLAAIVLQLKASGVDDILAFEFMDPPEHTSLLRALEQLYALEALDAKGNLSEEGKRMAEFPLDPTWAKALFISQKHGCTKEVIDLISLSSADNIFFSPHNQRDEANEARKKFISTQGDHLTKLNVLAEYLSSNGDREWCMRNFINQRALKNVMDVRKQLIMIAKRLGLDPEGSSCGRERDAVLQSLLSGFFQNIALLQPDGRSYKGLVSGNPVNIHPMSSMFGRRVEAIVYDEIVFTTKAYARGVSAIQASWLVDAAPRYYGNARIPRK